MFEVHIRKEFREDMERARSGDTHSVDRILRDFAPLVCKYQYVGKRPDADLLGELFLASILCVTRFQVDQNDLREFLAEARAVIENSEMLTSNVQTEAAVGGELPASEF